MQRQRGGSVPIGEVIGGLDGPVKAIREASPQARHHFTQGRSGESTCWSQRSGPRSRLHGANDGTVLIAPHQPRQPATSTSAPMARSSWSWLRALTTSSPTATCRA